MITGILMMRESFVVRLVILALPVPSTLLTSGREVERYGWMMSTAWAMKRLLRDVHTVDGVYITVVTMKMPQLFVQVSMTIKYIFILIDSVRLP